MTWTKVEETETESYWEDDETLDDMWIPKSLEDSIIELGRGLPEPCLTEPPQ